MRKREERRKRGFSKESVVLGGHLNHPHYLERWLSQSSAPGQGLGAEGGHSHESSRSC